MARKEAEKAAQKIVENQSRAKKKKEKDNYQEVKRKLEEAEKIAKKIALDQQREQKRLEQEMFTKKHEEEDCKKQIRKMKQTLKEIDELQGKPNLNDQQRQKIGKGKKLKRDLEACETKIESIQADLQKLESAQACYSNGQTRQ